MISKKDSKPILIKFPIGEGSEMIYDSEWTLIYGIIKETGLFDKKIYGIDSDFDLIVVLNATPITRRINKQTIFLCENMPTNVYKNGDYSITYVRPEINGEILIGLKTKLDISIPRLYFYYNKSLLSIQINFDDAKNKAYIPKNQKLPFELGGFVYTKKPKTKSETENKLKLISTNKIGYSSQYTNFSELTFEVV